MCLLLWTARDWTRHRMLANVFVEALMDLAANQIQSFVQDSRNLPQRFDKTNPMHSFACSDPNRIVIGFSTNFQ